MSLWKSLVFYFEGVLPKSRNVLF